MYYKLKEKYCLRGWEKLPWAIVERPSNRVRFLRDESEFKALSICNGLIDCDLVIIPENIRDIIKAAVSQGLVEECEYGDALLEDQKYHLYKNRYIKTAHWSITGKCNYRCKHCYMSAPTAKLGELSHEEVMDIIAQMDDCGIMHVSLTGGEPLIREDWWDIVDELVRRKIHISQIYSNGALVDKKLLEGLASRGLFPEFNMSYDGDEGWHDWLRGTPKAGEIVLRAFDLCHEMGFPAGAELCIHRGNKHLLRQSINTLAAHHCTNLKTNPVSDTELWEKYGQDMSISMDEVFALYCEYIPHFFEDGMPLSLMLGGAFMCAKGKTNFCIPLQKYDGSDACLRNTICGHARQTLYISPEGRMLPCISLSSADIQNEYPLISEIGLRQGLTESTYMSLIDTRVDDFLQEVDICRECEYAKICAGGCRASALLYGKNSLMEPDPACCTLFKGGWADRIRIAAEEAIAKRS